MKSAANCDHNIYVFYQAHNTITIAIIAKNIAIHAAGLYLKLEKRKNLDFPKKIKVLNGGDGEIRTLEELLTLTRFPNVRARTTTLHLRVCSGKFNMKFTACSLYDENRRKSIVNFVNLEKIFDEYKT